MEVILRIYRRRGSWRRSGSGFVGVALGKPMADGKRPVLRFVPARHGNRGLPVEGVIANCRAHLTRFGFTTITVERHDRPVAERAPANVQPVAAADPADTDASKA